MWAFGEKQETLGKAAEVMFSPSSNRVKALGVMIGLLFSPAPFAPALLAIDGPQDHAPKELRSRVEEFYSLLEVGRWNEAEAYLSQESKENFRSQNKTPFAGFKIDSIKMERDGQEAQALVHIQFYAGLPPTLLLAARTTRWRRVDGVWHVDIPKPDPYSLQSLFAARTQRGASPPEELKFKGHEYRLGEMQQGQRKVARFPFTNVTDHIVIISDVATGCECLRVLTEKREYKPGESGELAIQFDPTGFKYDYAQTIVVKTEPGSLRTFLTVKAFVAPPPPDGAKAEGNLNR